MEIHPLANIFPSMGMEEFNQLRMDIEEYGIRESIWTWDNKIIDGKHRYKACQLLGIRCPVKEYQGKEKDLASFIVSLNLHRRHLTESQRAMVAAKLAKLPSHRPKESASIEAVSQPEAAKMLNVSRPSVQRARSVIDYGEPELSQAVETGKISVSAASEVVDFPPIVQQDIVQKIDKGEKPAEVVRCFRAQFTGEIEWYTPADVLEDVRKFLGEIDLDPASTEKAQKTVQAKHFFTKEDNGLEREWHGKVWLNPPYSQPLITQFTEKMVKEYKNGNIQEAIMLTHNYTDTYWFHHAESSANKLCFTKGRIRFIRNDEELAAPVNGQTFFYFGNRGKEFAGTFKKRGFVR